MSAPSTILVTGAGGFIGGHLASRLIEDGYVVRCVDVKPLLKWHQLSPWANNLVLDLRDKSSCRLAVNGVSQIYNLAASMGGMGFIESHRAECMLNVLINTHLLQEAARQGVSRYFFASSACVYSALEQGTIREKPLSEDEAYPAMPEDGYGWEKLFSERMCRHFYEDFGLATKVARFHNIYGTHGTWQGGREKAPAAICRKVAEAKKSGNHTIEIWGDGQQMRSFTYIDDCVSGILKIMSGESCDPVNLGSDEVVSIDDLVTLVESIAGIRLKHTYLKEAPTGVRWRNSDNTRMRDLYGFAPSTTLHSGLSKTYPWIAEQLEIA